MSGGGCQGNVQEGKLSGEKNVLGDCSEKLSTGGIVMFWEGGKL